VFLICNITPKCRWCRMLLMHFYWVMHMQQTYFVGIGDAIIPHLYRMLLLCEFGYNVGDVMDRIFWATVCKMVCPIDAIGPFSVRLSCLWRWCIVAKRLDGSRSPPRPWPHWIRWGPSSPPQRGTAPNFRPMSVVDEWRDGSRCHLVGRQASA